MININHKAECVWDAIGLDEEELIKKLTSLTKVCVKEQKLPSEKIEMLSKQLNKLELAAIILMLEFKIRNLTPDPVSVEETNKGYT